MKNIIIVISLMLLSGCTCIKYSSPDVEASYCSTKDISDVKIEYNGVSVEIGKSENQAKEALGTVAKGVTEGLTGTSSKAKDLIRKKVMEALTNEE